MKFAWNINSEVLKTLASDSGVRMDDTAESPIRRARAKSRDGDSYQRPPSSLVFQMRLRRHECSYKNGGSVARLRDGLKKTRNIYPLKIRDDVKIQISLIIIYFTTHSIGKPPLDLGTVSSQPSAKKTSWGRGMTTFDDFFVVSICRLPRYLY